MTPIRPNLDLWEIPRHRWAVYAAITTVLRSEHPAREKVALALESLVLRGPAACAAELACRVGGPPPVPGVLWGFALADHPRDAILAVWVGRSHAPPPSVWQVRDIRDNIHTDTDIVALYRPGDSARTPYWSKE